MNRIARGLVAGACMGIMAVGTVLADVKTEEKAHVKFEGMLGRMANMFGGKAAREGIVSRVAVKGDRKMMVGGRYGQLIDLAEEKIYDIDFEKKSFKVTTFEEMRRRFREAQEQAKKRQSEHPDQANGRPGEGGREYEIDADTKETGAKKALNGHDTRQVVTTVTVREKGKTLEQSGGMVVSMDSWVAPTIASMKEMQGFQVRYGQKLAAGPATGASAEQMAAALGMFPMLTDALVRVNKEAAKVDGTPIATTLTVQSVKSAQEAAAAENEEESDGGGGLGGMLARKMMKKKKADPDAPKDRATVMTTTHEVLSVSTSVTPDDVTIPADFKDKS
jgi:hypothetical protein